MAMARVVSLPAFCSLHIVNLSKRASGVVHQLLHKSRGTGRGLRSVLRRTHHFSTSLQLQVLDELIKQQHWDLALLVYQEVKEAAWSSQICQLVSSMVALLAKEGRKQEMDTVLRDTHRRLGLSEKSKFGCALVGSYAQLGLWADARQQFDALSCFSGPQRFRSLLRAQASMNLPQEAEKTCEEMRIAGYEACVDDYKCLLFSYGRCGYFERMEGILELMQEDDKQTIDVTVFNMVLVSYGLPHKYLEMSAALERMLNAGIAPSIKSLNALTNACPSLWMTMEDDNTFMPGSASLLDEISAHVSSIQELSILESVLELGLPAGSTVWIGSTWTLNLHSMAVGTAYLMLMLWLKELAHRFKDGSSNAPNEVGLITGWGKHSEVAQGDSSLKAMVVAKLRMMQSPFKVDRYNKGRIVARGHLVRDWLLLTSQ